MYKSALELDPVTEPANNIGGDYQVTKGSQRGGGNVWNTDASKFLDCERS